MINLQASLFELTFLTMQTDVPSFLWATAQVQQRNTTARLLPIGAFGGRFTILAQTGRFSGQSQHVLFSDFRRSDPSRFLNSTSAVLFTVMMATFIWVVSSACGKKRSRSFQFPVSSFQFPVPSFQFPVSVYLLLAIFVLSLFS
jgi:hypothetical protein